MVKLAERFLMSYAEEGRIQTARSLRKHLRRFLAFYGCLRVAQAFGAPAL